MNEDQNVCATILLPTVLDSNWVCANVHRCISYTFVFTDYSLLKRSVWCRFNSKIHSNKINLAYSLCNNNQIEMRRWLTAEKLWKMKCQKYKHKIMKRRSFNSIEYATAKIKTKTIVEAAAINEVVHYMTVYCSCHVYTTHAYTLLCRQTAWNSMIFYNPFRKVLSCSNFFPIKKKKTKNNKLLSLCWESESVCDEREI